MDVVPFYSASWIKEITLSALFVPFPFPTCGTNWVIRCSSVSKQRGPADRRHPRLLFSWHYRTKWGRPYYCTPQSISRANINLKVVSIAWGANKMISWTQAVLLLSFVRKKICYSLKVHWVIIWSRLKSQSLGSELGQDSSSMYLDLTAHTNQSGSGKIAACLRTGEYEKYYYFKKSKRKTPSNWSLKLTDSPAPPPLFSVWKLCISSQTNSVLSGKLKSPCAFLFPFINSTAKKTPSRLS